jgi:uncharacterized hydrophobic protein (TIGR00341 family)
MALRLIELILPKEDSKEVQVLLKDHVALGVWHEKLSEDKILVRVLLSAEESEAMLDIFEKHFSNLEDFRIMLFSVEATIPRPETPEEKPSKKEDLLQKKDAETKVARISREELYLKISDASKISGVYIIMVILSSIVAAIGLMHNNLAIIIGAMVIAPLLGPNVALSLATTLGDRVLASTSLKANMAGILTTIVISVLLGFIFKVNPDIPEIASRTNVGIGDVVLALASGTAGVLAFTTGVSATLIGVMVAVALLPPLVTFGMLLGAGYWNATFNAMLLFLSNIICINLAGVITFIIQGIKPITWWEEEKAKKMTRTAISLWVLLLFALVIIIFLSQGR